MKLKAILSNLRPYTLMISIGCGFFAFLAFHNLTVLKPLRPCGYFFLDKLHWIVFFILFLAFSKIKFNEMKPHYWQLYMTVIMVSLSLLFALASTKTDDPLLKTCLIGVFICVITPTAASASVITGKLGGNESAITTYIIISNLVSAVAIPLILPLADGHVTTDFWLSFLTILKKIFPVIVIPLVLAIAVKVLFKKLHKLIVEHTKDLGFYLWAFVLFFLSAKTFANIHASKATSAGLMIMAITGLICAVSLFASGKIAGHFEKQKISAGQGIGQKNTLLAIWVTLCYLRPEDAIIPGTYVLWQNSINAFQMWLREKHLKECQQSCKTPYQE